MWIFYFPITGVVRPVAENSIGGEVALSNEWAMLILIALLVAYIWYNLRKNKFEKKKKSGKLKRLNVRK